MNENSSFASLFRGINAGSAGDADAIRTHNYGVMQCAPNINVLYGFSSKRCQRNRIQAANGDAAYIAGPCFQSESSNLMEDIDSYPIIARDNSTTQKIYTSDEFADAIHIAKTANEYYYNTEIATLNSGAALSIIVPQWQSNKGEGACILFTGDLDAFDEEGADFSWEGYLVGVPESHHWDIFDHQTQQTPLATAFLNAALSKDVCRQDKPADICIGLRAQECELISAPAGTTEPLAITSGGGCSTSAVWACLPDYDAASGKRCCEKPVVLKVMPLLAPLAAKSAAPLTKKISTASAANPALYSTAIWNAAKPAPSTLTTPAARSMMLALTPPTQIKNAAAASI